MELAPCVRDCFLPQSFPPDQGEIREGGTGCGDFFRILSGRQSIAQCPSP